MWRRLVDMLHWLIHKNKNVSEKNGKGGEKKGVTHGPGYAGNGGIMRVSRRRWPPPVIPPLTSSFFFIFAISRIIKTQI